MTNPGDHPPVSRSVATWLFVLYMLFVVYGSLVPLKYVYRSMDDAIRAFQHIPYLVLGVGSRADWIANGVLYAPLGFLAALFLRQTFQRTPQPLLIAGAVGFSMTLAVGVEFIQLFFPQRTVSLNDILSECLGGVVGVALSVKYSKWFQSLIVSLLHDRQRLKVLALDGYVFAYLAFALFPYDLLLSWSELSNKMDSNGWGWFFAGNSPQPTILILQLAVEVVMAVPFGLVLSRVTRSGTATYRQAMLFGLLFGVCIEVAQLFIASGISQGLSVLSRLIGVGCGLALFRSRDRWSIDHVASLLRRYTFPVAAVYLMALLEINGWVTSNWQGFQAAAKQVNQLSLVPFYYQYFTTEARALFSLAAVCISYVPLAILAWAHRRSPRFALGFAFLLATCIEVGKLFLLRPHPDLTNILFACAASWSTVHLMRQFFRSEPKPVQPILPVDADGRGPSPLKQVPLWLPPCLVATGVWAATFPAFPVLVCVVLTACAAAVWHRPVWVFAIIPAALPVFDLAPWSGRFFLDEFDALLLVGLAIGCARVPALPRGRMQTDALLTAVTALVALSFGVSAVRGMLPLHLPDPNSFNNYYSPYNALRIGKGAAWAFLAYVLSMRLMAAGIDARRQFAWGMTVGLGLTVAVIVWERVAFSGLWDFSGGYRVTGPFSSIHVGGAYIECFLAVATPFLMTRMLERRHWFVRLVGFLLLLATTYALMVTYSRNGYSAFAVAVCTVLLVALLKTRQFLRTGVIVAALAGAMFLVARPIFKGEYAQSRIATVNADLLVRKAHWEDALSIRDHDWATSLFGMGLGRYPETNYWRSTKHNRAGTYRLESEAGNTYLRLASGDSIYVEQLASIVPGQKYILKLDVRSTHASNRITIPICEKWMLASYNCIWRSIELGKDFGTWRHIEVAFTARELSISPWYSQRPIKFSLYCDVPKSTIDIDNVRLEDIHGSNLLRNGDFSQGLDRWFFSSDGHLQWHTKSLFYGVLFDQGWFGLATVGAFLLLAIGLATRNIYRGDAFAISGLAALSSFLVVGLFDTLIDAPRFLFLLLLLALLAASRPAVSRPA